MRNVRFLNEICTIKNLRNINWKIHTTLAISKWVKGKSKYKKPILQHSIYQRRFLNGDDNWMWRRKTQKAMPSSQIFILNVWTGIQQLMFHMINIIYDFDISFNFHVPLYWEFRRAHLKYFDFCVDYFGQTYLRKWMKCFLWIWNKFIGSHKNSIYGAFNIKKCSCFSFMISGLEHWFNTLSNTETTIPNIHNFILIIFYSKNYKGKHNKLI